MSDRTQQWDVKGDDHRVVWDKVTRTSICLLKPQWHTVTSMAEKLSI